MRHGLVLLLQQQQQQRTEILPPPLRSILFFFFFFFGCTNRNREFCSFAFDRDLLICCPATVIIAVVLLLLLLPSPPANYCAANMRYSLISSLLIADNDGDRGRDSLNL